jgi:PKD repeat protein
MKRILLFMIGTLLIGISGEVIAQPCYAPVINSVSVGKYDWQVYWTGSPSDSAWQIIVAVKGDTSNTILDSIVVNQYREIDGYGSVYIYTPMPTNKTFNIYVRTICMPGDTSAWLTPPYNIINIPKAPISNVKAVFEGSDILITWGMDQAGYFPVYRYDYQTNTEMFAGTASYTPYFYDYGLSPGWYSYKVFSPTGDSALSNKVEYTNCYNTFGFEPNILDSTVALYIDSTRAMKFYWNYGDGNTSMINLSTQYYKYDKLGIYNICLTTTDSSGCSAHYCQEINLGVDVNSIITPAFTPLADSGLLFTFYNNTQPIDSMNFYWTFGDGKTSTEIQPDHPYLKPGNYEVCLTATQQLTKKTASTCQQVKVGSTGCDLTASFDFRITGSTNDSIQFINLSTGNIGNYNWYFDDGTVSTEKGPAHQFKSGIHKVLLIISDPGLKCSDQTKQIIQLGTVDCKADFNYSVGANDSVTFNNNSGGNIAKYYWSFGDGSFSVDQNPVHPFGKQGKYFVDLTVENAGGTCMDKIEKEVQVGEINCSARFSYVVDIPNLTLYCNNEAIGDATQYYWTYGDGSFSAKPDAVHQFKYPGYYSVGLNTYNALTGCMDYFKTTVLVGSESIISKPDFFYNVDAGTRKVRFKDNSIGSVKNNIWDFGDGIISNDKDTTSHTYPHGGYYDVCMTVVTNDDVPNMICKWIQVAPDPKTDCYADFNFSTDSVKKEVSLVSQSLGKPTNFIWDLGDGYTSNKQDSLKHAYTGAGYYLVALHISTAAGCESNGYKLINIGQPYGLYIKFGYDPKHYNSKAGGYPVDFGGAGLGDNSRLRWNFGDGSVNSTNMTPTHVYTNPGKYWVCLNVSDTVTHEESYECDSVSTQTMCQNDSIDPVAQCKNYTLPISGSTVDISPLDVNDNSTDDCGIYMYSLDNKTFTPANEGPNLIHLTVMDYNSNTATCSAIVTVVITGISSTSLNKVDLKISPNPLHNFMTVRFNLPATCITELSVYDLLGKRVETLSAMKLSEGKQILTYDASGLKSGSYIIQLKTSTGIINRQVFIKQ